MIPSDETSADARHDAPWSHRLHPVQRGVLTLAAGAASAFVGTFAHRMGASADIPYGLVLALAIVGASAWSARSRSGIVGLGLHLVSSSMVAWGMAFGGPGGDATTPVGFSGGSLPWFSQHAGYIWLYGLIVVQVLLLVLPARLFRATRTRRRSPGGAVGQGDGVDVTRSGR
ncbi:alcohol dehydrogenase [uncultured Bifidobacterium sp.]|uniref:alcohol dehydrogenase n=1 Tax=uncultured Bifidobacterium sp. TaxID=165187 RepID=UPI0028DB89D7|nr:alcohol dehydrogenase [uncultured Bifidobacterium sp.]